MMRIIYFILAIHSAFQFHGVSGFPSGAGHCEEGDLNGKNAFQHGNTGGGPLSNGLLKIFVGANELKTWTPTTLEANKTYRVTLNRGNNFNFRGFLFRLSSLDGKNVHDTLFPADDSSVRTLEFGCDPIISAVTHVTNNDKNSIYFDFEYLGNTADNLQLDVTIMISKDFGNWFFSRYQLKVESPSTSEPSSAPIRVTPEPSSEPTEVPSKAPTEATDSPSSSPLPPVCEDSTYRFKTIRPNDRKRIWTSCAWIAKKVDRRCAWKNVVTYCPLTCNACDPCVDAKGKFKFWRQPTDAYKWLRNCRWVGLDSTKRCAIVDMDRTCRKTCGNCPAP